MKSDSAEKVTGETPVCFCKESKKNEDDEKATLKKACPYIYVQHVTLDGFACRCSRKRRWTRTPFRSEERRMTTTSAVHKTARLRAPVLQKEEVAYTSMCTIYIYGCSIQFLARAVKVSRNNIREIERQVDREENEPKAANRRQVLIHITILKCSQKNSELSLVIAERRQAFHPLFLYTAQGVRYTYIPSCTNALSSRCLKKATYSHRRINI